MSAKINDKKGGEVACKLAFALCSNTDVCNDEYLDKCCEEHGVCPFYKTVWFYVVIGVVALLILLCIGASIFCCIRRKKKNGGGHSSNKSATGEE